MKATYKQYASYIEHIKVALKIKSTTRIKIEFRANLGNRAGFTTMFKSGKILMRISNYYTHNETLQILMHEFKHAQQMQNGRLSINSNLEWFWLGKPVKVHRANRNDKSKYHLSPWEIEAYAYDKGTEVMFPNGELPEPRKYIGAANNGAVKFYKVKG